MLNYQRDPEDQYENMTRSHEIHGKNCDMCDSPKNQHGPANAWLSKNGFSNLKHSKIILGFLVKMYLQLWPFTSYKYL